jgi:hypothetical protein
MPLSKIHVPDQLAVKSCQSIAEELHLSLVEICGVNPDDNFCLISRYTQQDMIVHPTFLGNRDPSLSVFVEITLLTGRTDVQKELFYKDFRKRLNNLGFEANNAIIFLTENNSIDWSFSDAGSVKHVLSL